VREVPPWVYQFADSSCRILGGSHQIIQDLLAEARECWKREREEQVSVYASDTSNEWRLITTRPKRPLESIILDTGVKEAILEDALDFLDNKEWYSVRGIPFRRGYLLVSLTCIHACTHASSRR
jgi:chaperone BCS1